MVEVISFYKQHDTRDEMGLAQIRDVFAEIFFPGTTTIQTRARYFLFIPWLYTSFEKNKVTSSKIQDRMRSSELQIMHALESAGEDEGIIGKRSGAGLQRFPSSIYWNGLQTWGILRFPGYVDQYYRSLDRYYQINNINPYSESVEFFQEKRANWDPNLPAPPVDFPSNATFQLSPLEASYLRERLMISCGKSLLAYLVNHCSPVQVDFAWLHPEQTSFPDYLQEMLIHARNFSEVMQGSALLYNLMLAEKRNSAKLIEEYHNLIYCWFEQLMIIERDLFTWDRKRFWEIVTIQRVIHPATRLFVNEWLTVLLNEKQIRNLSSYPRARTIIHNREYQLKRNRSRLENPRHLELWTGNAGTAKLDFRWGIGNRIVRDIQIGLGRE